MVTLIMSFDVAGHHMPKIELHGTLGSLNVPDPNSFNGDILFMSRSDAEWKTLEHQMEEQRRGVGVAEMFQAIDENRPHCASGEMAFHVLDIMESILGLRKTGQAIVLQTTCPQPNPFSGFPVSV